MSPKARQTSALHVQGLPTRTHRCYLPLGFGHRHKSGASFPQARQADAWTKQKQSSLQEHEQKCRPSALETYPSMPKRLRACGSFPGLDWGVRGNQWEGCPSTSSKLPKGTGLLQSIHLQLIRLPGVQPNMACPAPKVKVDVKQ